MRTWQFFLVSLAVALAVFFAARLYQNDYLFFAGYVVLGSNGVLAWGDYKRQLNHAQGELKQVQAHRQELKNRVDLLDPRRVDPDLSDELIRRELGVVHHDEVIVPLN